MRKKDSVNNKRKLKNILVNPKYQIRYILWLTFAGLFLTLLNSAVFYSFIKENYVTLVDLAPMTDDVRIQLYKELHQIVGYLVVIGMIFFGLLVMLGLALSHRTVGPLYHFKRVFNEIRDGKFDTRVRLRPNDDFQDVASSFNEMMDAVAQRKQ